MPDTPYTDADLRAEAARQHAAALHAPDRVAVGEEMELQPIPSTVIGLEPDTGEPLKMSRTWKQLSDDDFHDAHNQVHELLEDAVDLSQWAVNLGASFLTRTTGLVWGYGDNWHLAVQVAHRRGIAEDLHAALVDAVRAAVNGVIADCGLDAPELPQTDAQAVTR